ncbi:bifunctional 3-hydroxydecanoyl-ACP dehydratase/trans-2-decenoyl-ACP isomerase [Phenylobacterium sp.]|uniref:bifunctional 3-hydroxydecanoyl-ACP dehydratase/trans-2-decenoyl-ACP isomerase n=1 Tax=Phenylobacterium sp. TaxID=1871053 RepID=UPI0025DF5BB0|nr:bifunctional 3-hydroxydecanoyl-ACP dehydratase/trans-2-decenoyl-ACP isomerase [Phenylobacterium sp.]MCA3720687.1 bifunctional 3-hydroxydecanoyl-ACP dehydratase/trans-2-decenoyl-ACP isomerase [Phenylobacterium sp.]
MTRQSSFSYDELIDCAKGRMFGDGNAKLPLPPMLMFDRITSITEDGGDAGKGRVVAEQDITPDLWFFACHFDNDPVMPGCLGEDALWQLLGFFLGWKGYKGRGRARGGEIKFNGSVFPSAKLVTYDLHITRLVDQRLTMGIADASVLVDGQKIYQARNLRTILATGS